MAPAVSPCRAQSTRVKSYDALAAWRERAQDVRGFALSCAHYLAEEAPEETLAAVLAFLEE